MMSLANIDILSLYRQHMQHSERPEKSAQEWDVRAPEMQKKSLSSPYTAALLARINLEGIKTVVDVGCGNGALSIPLAQRVEQVIAVDFSPAMLAALKTNAQQHSLDNIHYVQRAWEDDWQDIPACDLLLSSRSSTVRDIGVIWEKIQSHALKRVVLTQPVNGSFTDPDILQMIERPLENAPDYIYTLNLLHQHNIHPTLNYIETHSRLAFSQNFSDFLARVEWSFGELTGRQKERLQQWYQADEQRAYLGGRPMRWALIEFAID